MVRKLDHGLELHGDLVEELGHFDHKHIESVAHVTEDHRVMRTLEDIEQDL
jgi:hypothetical protein